MRKSLELALTAVLCLFPPMTLAQAEEQLRTLAINGQLGEVGLLQMNNKMYIDLQRLAQIAKGAISYEGNRIVADVPCASSPSPERSGEAEQGADRLFSREFMKAGIEEIALMREWASTLANAIQNGYPIAENWVADHRAQAQSGLAIASTAMSTDADRDGLQLLRREFENVQAWSNMLLASRKSLDTAKYALSPDTLRSDPLSQKIVSCAHYLGQMLASGSYEENSSCH
jgi:hypothetical protein